MKLSKFVCLPAAALLLASAIPALCQLSPEQKAFDFQALASLYIKQYAPYEWKVATQKFDLFQLRPWIDRARQSKDDLEFYEVLAEYVNKLNDGHSSYVTPSSFIAYIDAGVDIYEGKVLFDIIDRRSLPLSDYPFEIGDELVAVDGKNVDVLMDEILRLTNWANPRSSRRWAAELLLFRPQYYLPRAGELGDNVVLLVRRQNGDLQSFEVPWTKTGRAMKTVGPVPTIRTERLTTGPQREAGWSGATWREPLLKLQNFRARDLRNVVGLGGRTPFYQLPQGFVQRLGRRTSDYFYSGTYVSDGVRIGLIRIHDFQPLPFEFLGIATQQFESEIAFMQANTDGLVVDVSRNLGGYGCWAVDLLARLMPKPFSTFGLEIRPTLDWVNSFANAIEIAEEEEAEQWEINLLKAVYKQIEMAYSEHRGRTGPVPVCGLTMERAPATDQSGRPRYYSKPIVLLVDEFSSSAAEIFPAIFQDNARGPVFGYRTAGLGGSVGSSPAGFYSEGTASVTQSLIWRQKDVIAPDFPPSHYVENVGVRPDVDYDAMTRANLEAKWKPYVDAFTEAIKQEVARSQPPQP